LGKQNPDDLEDEETKKEREGLELLVSAGKGQSLLEFKADAKDKRFAISKDMYIDPTHKDYKKIADGEFHKEQLEKRRKFHQ